MPSSVAEFLFMIATPDLAGKNTKEYYHRNRRISLAGDFWAQWILQLQLIRIPTKATFIAFLKIPGK